MDNKTLKELKVKELIDLFDDKEGIVVSDYSGLNANDITDLRKKVRNAGCSAKIEKNRMVKRSFDSIKLSYPEGLLTGPNIYFKVDSGMPDLCKLLVDFAKENESFNIKGAILDGEYIDSDQVNDLSKLPSREELIAKTVGLIKSPLSGLVGTLSNPLRGFINVLNNVKNNK